MTDREQRLVQAVDRWLAAVEAGAPLSRAELLEEYADVRTELEDCLGSLDFIHRAAREPTAPDADSACEERFDAEPTSDPLQDTVLGDYRLKQQIGRGGMGVVYEAEQLTLQRRVAVKVLPFAAALDERRLQRFRHEAMSAAALHHPHIVPVFLVGHEKGTHFYVMPLITGQSLAHWLAGAMQEAVHRNAVAAGNAADSGRVPGKDDDQTASTADRPGFTLPDGDGRLQQLARLFAPVADALEHAHEAGIVHRDVKPSNLLLDGSGKLWLTDFGLALRADSQGLTVTGDIVGTLRYMSPEQVFGNRATVDHRSDVYSLGLSLYELIARRPAFPATSRAALIQQISQATPQSLRSSRDQVPADLCTIVEKAIARDPDDRYQTAAALAEDLRRFATGRQVTARRPTLRRRLTVWARRHHTAVTAAVVVGLLSFAGLVAGNIALAAEQQRTQTALTESQELLQEYHTTLREISGVLNRNQLYGEPAYATMIKDFADVLGTRSRILQQLAQDHPQVRESLMQHLRSVAVASWHAGDRSTARALFQQVRWLAERSVAFHRTQTRQDSSVDTLCGLLSALECLGNAERYARFDDADGQRRYEEGIELASTALQSATSPSPPPDPESRLLYWLGFLQAEKIRLYGSGADKAEATAVGDRALAGEREAADNLRRSLERAPSAVTRRRLAVVLDRIHQRASHGGQLATALEAAEEVVRLRADNCAEAFLPADVNDYCEALGRLVSTALRSRDSRRAADVNDELLRTARRGLREFGTRELREHYARACSHRLRDIGMGQRTMEDPSRLLREARRLFYRHDHQRQLMDLAVISTMVVSRLLPDESHSEAARRQAYQEMALTVRLSDDLRDDGQAARQDGEQMLQQMQTHNEQLRTLLKLDTETPTNTPADTSAGPSADTPADPSADTSADGSAGSAEPEADIVKE